MLSIIRKKCGIEVNEIFFAPDPDQIALSSSIGFFIQAAKPLESFYRFTTSVIDLAQPAGILFSRLSSGARYKIRRAEREGMTVAYDHAPRDTTVHEFATFFDEFACNKGVSRCNIKKLLALCERRALMITRTQHHSGRCLVMHAYVADYQATRIRLLYSASHFRKTTDTEERNLIGRANRLLHWSTIQHAKDSGFTRYDLGGMPIESTDAAKSAIARFKSEFGGSHITEYNGYTSRNPFLRYTIPTLRRLFA